MTISRGRFLGAAGRSSGGTAPTPPPSVSYPRVYYSEGSYYALCCAITYSDVDYNIIGGVTGLTQYIGTLGATYATVGAPETSAPEPVELKSGGDDMGIDGTSNISAPLMLAPDPSTIFVASSLKAALISDLAGYGITPVLVIDDVFVATGAGNEYTFTLASITGAGATLWGGDGAGGVR